MAEIQLEKTALGLELGSTRIKAVLIGPEHAVLASGAPVSYTHLDVYKRQEIWYNNLKAAACAAARVHGTRLCANAQDFENIKPCKTAAGAVLLRPLCGVMV